MIWHCHSVEYVDIPASDNPTKTNPTKTKTQVFKKRHV